MANRKALSSSRQAMNAVQPISTYEVLELFYLYWLQSHSVFETRREFVLELFYLYWLQNSCFINPLAGCGFGTVLSVLVTKQSVIKLLNSTGFGIVLFVLITKRTVTISGGNCTGNKTKPSDHVQLFYLYWKQNS